MAYHARLGPSGAYIWMACTASPGESDGKPNEGNDASRMGTACHGVASVCLISGKQPEAYLDQSFIFGKDKTGDRQEDLACYLSVADLTVEYELPITEEYVEHVNAYVAYVRDVHATVGGQMFIEQRVPIDHITGEPGAGGTSDTIIIAGDTAWVIDAKFGRNKVVAMEMVKPALPHPITGDMEQPVYAPNSQLAMYASGALRKHDPFGLVSIIRLVIVQPPLHHVSEYAMTVSDLDAFIDSVRQAAEATRTNPTYTPGDHCTWCKGRVTCKARDEYVLRTSLEGFSDITSPEQIAAARTRAVSPTMIGVLFSKIGMIQEWCSDIAQRAFDELQAGRPLVREDGMSYKLVAGRAGPRQWADENEAAARLKSIGLSPAQMYDYSLISPPSAEKLAKPKKNRKGEIVKPAAIGEKQWAELCDLVRQSDPKATIALESDPRPALPLAVSGFEDVSQPSTEEVDFFN